jgi:hypothetical protein
MRCVPKQVIVASRPRVIEFVFGYENSVTRNPKVVIAAGSHRDLRLPSFLGFLLAGSGLRRRKEVVHACGSTADEDERKAVAVAASLGHNAQPGEVPALRPVTRCGL